MSNTCPPPPQEIVRPKYDLKINSDLALNHLLKYAFACRGDRHPRVQSLHRTGDPDRGRLLGAGHRADAQVLTTAGQLTWFPAL